MKRLRRSLRRALILVMFPGLAFAGAEWTVDSYGNLDSGGQAKIGLKMVGKPVNLNVQGSVAGSLTIECGNEACSSTNPGFIWLPDDANAGHAQFFKITSNVVLTPTGATWGNDTFGNMVDAVLNVFAVNSAGNLVWCLWYAPYPDGVMNSATRDSTTASDVNLPEELFCNAAIPSDDPITPVWWVRVNLADSTDTWTVQTGDGDINVGSADGIWRPWNTNHTGCSSGPLINYQRWTTFGNTVCIKISTNNCTSSAATFTMTGPLKTSEGIGSGAVFGLCSVEDNSVEQTIAGMYSSTSASSVTITIEKNGDLGGEDWTAANAKSHIGQFCYEALK